ncbi:type III-B CRISPR-associated protein Cas10/Cmr2 [Bacillus alveayuensis]|uniref:type III-B CRISPR-associated protein Cas10/Cmr2 n=1 Tax=Aeribacillus alveayuensis TaxID=279215 RepID=UPI0005D11C36|nr:type III-B CRISPR-associated protein Cas10/Cmr2 [Bacillus alveayuensis]
MSHQHIFVFTIGPVQSFIAAARKTEDFWSGSYLISHLVQEAMKFLYEEVTDFQIVYPEISKKELFEPELENIHIASLPNRFTAIIPRNQEETVDLLKRAEERVRYSFYQLCDFAVQEVFPKTFHSKLKKQVEEQIDSLLEVYWVAETFETESDFKEVKEILEQRLGALKNEKQFSQIQQTGFTCKVCKERDSLSYETITENDNYRQIREKLDNTWSQKKSKVAFRVEKNEYLCGVCLGKRFAREYFKEFYQIPTGFNRFESTKEISGDNKYYAILMMDGDNMGKWFSVDDIESYRNLSRKLSYFAKHVVPSIVEQKYNGRLIYAGGDDVLAFVPVDQALDIAASLRFAFSDEEKGLGSGATASAGIIIGHEKSPLQQQLNNVRRLEKKAKSYVHSKSNKKKNALAIALHTRSGEISEAVLPWEQNGFKTCEILQSIIHFLQTSLSPTFIYHFSQAFQPLIHHREKEYKITHNEMMETELRRLIIRSKKEGQPIEQLDNYIDHLLFLHDVSPSTMEFLHILKMLTFFKKRNQEDELNGEKNRVKAG